MALPRIAAQMYTIRQSLQKPADIAASCKKLADIGYRAVQASGLGPVEPKQLKSIFDDAGLACVITHIGYDQCTEQTQKVIEDLQILNCPATAIGAMPGKFRSVEGVKTFAAAMEKAGAAMKAAGIALGYHNHSFEFEKIGGKLLMDRIFEATSREHVFAEIDTYWVHHGGGDPSAWIRRFAGNLPVVHYKDYGILNGQVVMLEVGEGNLDWDAINAACQDAGVEYAAVEQDECNGRDPFESLAISFRNLRAMGLPA